MIQSDFHHKIIKLEEHVNKLYHSLEKKIQENKKTEQGKLKKIFVELDDLNHVVFELKNQDELFPRVTNLETKMNQMEENLIQQIQNMEKKYSILERVMLNKVEEQQKQIEHLFEMVKKFETKLEDLFKDVGVVKEELKTKISIHPNYFSEN